ncbi:MAG: FO synthase [Chroococcopsis gigantea SAG 12.99]|jgi:FO synthase subunit 1|nr:7,8-didemethyl-8-hydroxy-5-deazariboflavin synthase subunit CofG [Chlorogloea purpurea SAG 13.99]MDV3000743.1 FO synthase [Chroococcopsis gigantea SAG 12.99]
MTISTDYSRVVTYSRAYTIVPTYECFNRCSYCNFRTDIGKSPWLSLSQAREILKTLPGEVTEILILSGEVHPKAPDRQAWSERIYDLGKLALDMGFMPHTNAGILSYEEMKKLKEVNVSMGLMLEQITPDLLLTVHRHAPSKIPALRLEQLHWAGELRIPFTTGLLLGIGEKETHRWDTLEAITHIHQRWGHIQEVILQPYNVGTKEAWQGESFQPEMLPALVERAREILPADITIQIPPNLVASDSVLFQCLEAGARDLGGIVPKDEVNPDYEHSNLELLTRKLAARGWQLKPRLPIYPQYEGWLTEKAQPQD